MKPRKPRVPAWTPKFTYDKERYIKAAFYDDERERHRVSTGTTDMQEAVGIINERVAILQSNSGLQEAPMTLQDAFKRMQRAEWRDQKDYMKRLRTSKMLLEWFGAHTLLSDISKSMISDYISYLRDDLENSNATINRKLAIIKRTLNVAVKEWDELDHAIYIPTFKEKRGGHREFLSESQFSAILGACDCHIHATLFLLLYETGMRPSEALNSRRADYIFTGNYIKLKDTKNGEDWLTPMSDKAADAVISLLQMEEGNPFQTITPSSMRHYFNKGRKALGMMENPGFTPYALRHTFAKRMLDSGLSTAEVQGLMHHKSITTTEVYTQYSGQELLKLRDKLQTSKQPIGDI